VLSSFLRFVPVCLCPKGKGRQGQSNSSLNNFAVREELSGKYTKKENKKSILKIKILKLPYE
jgi:hypothetical protein